MSQAHTVAVPQLENAAIATLRSRKNGHQAQPDADVAETFDLIPAMVVVMDCEHTIVNLNQAAMRAAGRKKSDCVGVKFWELFDNPDCRAGTCAAAQAVRTRATCEGLARASVNGERSRCW